MTAPDMHKAPKVQPKFSHLVTDNFWNRHPVLVQGLALAPALVASTSALNALALAVCLMLVALPCSLFASLVGVRLPKWTRVPLYALLAAGAYIPVYSWINTFYPAANSNLGAFLPLLVVSSFVYTKAEKRALYLQPHMALLDTLLGGISFGLLAFCLGSAREIFGAGRWMGTPVSAIQTPMSALLLPFSGFLIAGFLAALIQHFRVKKTGVDAAALWESDLEWDGTAVLDPDNAPRETHLLVSGLMAAPIPGQEKEPADTTPIQQDAQSMMQPKHAADAADAANGADGADAVDEEVRHD